MPFFSISRLWKILALLLLLGVALLVLIFSIFRSQTLATFEEERRFQNNNTIFYDLEGQPFHVIQGEEDRKYVSLSKTSRNLQMAVVAIEDARFFQHYGFDPIRIFGATLRYLKNPSAAQGASTITQQLVKLSLLSPERTLSRKLSELWMAIALESHYSKPEILEFYLNKVYLGHRNYGVENAALNYFHKSAKDLTLAEGAFIAGLIKKPEGYSPFVNLKGARTRQLLVLMRMHALGWISKEEYQAAISEHILIRQRRQSDLNLAPYFITHVLTDLKQRYSTNQIYGGGLRIYTTLNRKYQTALEQVIRERFAQPRSFEEVGAVSLDPGTGFVLALVGGSDFNQSEFNRVTQAMRQPGSSFKPILYAAALSQGIRPYDTFVDEPVQYANGNGQDEPAYYEPENYSGEYMGEITLAQALKVSNNIVSVEVLKKVGIPNLAKVAARFGLEIPPEKGLCLALGCAEINLLNLTRAYGAFANEGQLNPAVFILKVTDSSGRVLEEYKPVPSVPVLSPAQAYQMNLMLQEVVNAGTGRAAKLDSEPVGGKTGTSDNYRDAWFIGYTAGLVSGFWVGNDNNRPMENETGGKTPARLWKAYMTSLPAGEFEKTLPVNPDFMEVELCNVTGKKANPYCPSVSWYPVRREELPLKECDQHDEAAAAQRVDGLEAEPYPEPEPLDPTDPTDLP